MSEFDDFVSKAISVHGGFYSYDMDEFISRSKKTKILCPLHGSFLQNPRLHELGQGCRKCSYYKSASHKRLSQEDFLSKAKEVHGETYDYSKSIYEVSVKKIIVICRTHGEFQITPNKHLGGRGCARCGRDRAKLSKIKSTAKFIKDAIKIHGEKYDYSRSIYVSAHDKLRIICQAHGEFYQTPASHVQGVGCARCGFDLTAWNKSAYVKCSEKNNKSCVYLIRCFNENESFFKVGITSTEISYRFKKGKMPYSYEVLSKVSSGPANDWDDEKRIHRMLKPFSYRPLISFGGEFECFSKLNDEAKIFFGVA